MIDSIVERSWLLVLGAIVALVLVEELIPDRREDSAGASRIITNFALYGLSVALLELLAVALPVLTLGPTPLVPSFGLIYWLQLQWMAGACALLVIDSLVAYWLHRASHQVPLLWRFHSVHHTDCEMDVTTGIRHHPLELIPATAGQFFAALICGAMPDQVIVVALINTLWALLTHASIGRTALQFPRGFRLLVSPAFHRLHHSADRSQTDSNYGNTFAAWDRLFNTESDPMQEKVRRLGLNGQSVSSEKLTAQLLLPFRNRRESFPVTRPEE
jgi:sterol desaturase/sphingolipid hydroxylase (fatty acid hydroxylase superfamily)